MSAWILTAVAAAFLALLAVGFVKHGRTYRAPSQSKWPSVVKVELAGSGQATGTLLDRLGKRGSDALRRALRVDDTMIVPGYTGLLLALSGLSVVWIGAASSDALEAVGVGLGLVSLLLAVTAGALDLVENRALRHALDGWRRIPVPVTPDETEAAYRQELRRQQVTTIDPATHTARRAALWKLRLLTLVVVWVLLASVIAVTDALSR